MDLSKWCEIEDVSDKDLFERQKRAWLITRHWTHGGETIYYMILTDDGEYQMYDTDGNDLTPNLSIFKGYIDAVKKWDLKNSLSPETKDSFNSLIDVI
jgi:hypothetical protein